MVVTVLRALDVAWLIASGKIGELRRVKVPVESSLMLGSRETRADAEFSEMFWERAIISHFLGLSSRPISFSLGMSVAMSLVTLLRFPPRVPSSRYHRFRWLFSSLMIGSMARAKKQRTQRVSLLHSCFRENCLLPNEQWCCLTICLPY